jgi:hypothetical protein
MALFLKSTGSVSRKNLYNRVMTFIFVLACNVLKKSSEMQIATEVN